jgi:hypothetical protein
VYVYQLSPTLFNTCRACFQAIKQRAKRKNLFCNPGHFCNLVSEFNGLVSKRVGLLVGPFYFVMPAGFGLANSFYTLPQQTPLLPEI